MKPTSPLFEVSMVNLTAEAASALPDLGSSHVGRINEVQLLTLLQKFQAIDAIQNHDADPRITIETATAKFLVRTGRGKLFLYDARDAGSSFIESDPEGVIAQLTHAAASDGDQGLAAPSASKSSRLPHKAIAVSILAAGLSLNGYTVYSVYHAPSVNQIPAVTYVTAPNELTALRQSAAGRYATGDAPGDRVIDVQANGAVRFLKLTPRGERLDSEDTFRLARYDGKLCLATAGHGIIDIINIDSVVYYRDPYRRGR